MDDIWEYAIIGISSDDDLRVEYNLNQLGKEGWELVAVTGNNTHRAFFKRKKSNGHSKLQDQ